MTGWVALLRAVNVGGNNKIPMVELAALAGRLGLMQARTYIASGNLIFASALGEHDLRGLIEDGIEAEFGTRIGVLVRSAEELADVAACCPWPERAGNRVVVLFTDVEPSLDGVRNQAGEVLALGRREIFIDYDEGMGTSKLAVPAAKSGTARNMNTVRKLAELAGSLI
ncbi:MULTISPECIES: DUF1697 domain-containing protein [unclassified Novosphingobium]|uniref:DUF1697 domain-containing protein n=1 Tax=unclassified Novosphingobium TaxID=2644732 RepID=UPI0025F7427C|nr:MULTISPECIES: DUF1697 domain-containing protein [unclassified Novosphingobium]HQV03378.1 DUF1697 domain-containing protein [Novosphingobium sp.]